MDRMKIYVKTALKLFSSVTIISIGMFILYEYIFNINLDWNFKHIFFIIILSFISTHHYLQTEVELNIEVNRFFESFKEKLNHSPWTIISETDKSMILQPKFDRPYSWLYKEKVSISIEENIVKLKGAKLYVDKIESIISKENTKWDKNWFKYLGNCVIVLIIFLPVLLHFGVITNLQSSYHEFKVSDIEKITFNENLKLGNMVNNINNYGGVAENEEYIFYVKNHLQLCRSDQNFGNEIYLINKPSGSGMSYLNVMDDWIFYSSGKTFNRMKIDGSKNETIYSLGYLMDIHVMDNWIYFISFRDNSKIYKMDVNGQNLQKLSDFAVKDISIYENRIYYSYEKNEKSYLESMDLKGEDKKVVANFLSYNLIKDKDILYFIDNKDFNIYKFNSIQDKEPKKLFEGKISKFTLVDNWIYFSEHSEDVGYPGKGLYKIDVNGNNKQKINNDNNIEYLNNIGDWILFSSSKGNEYPKLQRMNIKDNKVIEMN